MALASARQDPAFTPQNWSEADQQAFVSSAMDLVTTNFGLLRRLKSEMPDNIRQEADRVLSLEYKTRQRFQFFGALRLSTILTRIHGDYHLGQVLFTGTDFVIIDFEGEPARPLEERRKKRSPLQDVAGMVRSFHYAAYAALFLEGGREVVMGGPAETWVRHWHRWVTAAFLRAYREAVEPAGVVPAEDTELSRLLDLFMLEKAVYELGYELDNRPEWLVIPARGLVELLGV